MDYIDIVKRSWEITWRYRILWLFGLLAGGTANVQSNYDFSGGDFSDPEAALDGMAFQGEQATQLLDTYLGPLLGIMIALAVVALIVAIAMFVISIAAQGGLIHLANEAAEGRTPRGGDGWRAGFRYWGRTFLIGLVIGLPMLVLIGVFIAVLFFSVGGIIAGAASSSGGEAALGGLAGVCCGSAIFIPLMIIAVFVLTGVMQLALRYGIIDDVPAMQALSAGWAAFRARWKNVFGIFVTLWVVGIAYGVVVGVIAALFIVPATMSLMSGDVGPFILISFVLSLILLLPSAILAAFQSSTWTVFFRILTGKTVQTRPEIAAPVGAAPAVTPAGDVGSSSESKTPSEPIEPEGYLPPPPPVVTEPSSEDGPPPDA